jgi:hypothetical protein
MEKGHEYGKREKEGNRLALEKIYLPIIGIGKRPI